jgi:hypothetical protein
MLPSAGIQQPACNVEARREATRNHRIACQLKRWLGRRTQNRFRLPL